MKKNIKFYTCYCPLNQTVIQAGHIAPSFIEAADAHAASAFVKWKFFVSFLSSSSSSLSLSLVLVLSVSRGHQTQRLIENITSSTGLSKYVTSKALFPPALGLYFELTFNKIYGNISRLQYGFHAFC